MTDEHVHISDEPLEPMRVARPSFAACGRDDDLVRLAARTEWLIVDVPTVVTVEADGVRRDPTDGERERCVQEFAALLIEHSVWDSGFMIDQAWLAAAREAGLNLGAEGTRLPGRSSISARRFITERALEENLDLLMAAAREYHALANRMMRRLAETLGVDLREFAASRSWHRHASRGSLVIRGAEFAYFFHGFDCAFIHNAWGLKVEARLGCGPDFGVLDPGFFLDYIHGRGPKYAPLARALRDWRANMQRALMFMERRGLARRLGSGPLLEDSWVVVDGASDPAKGAE